MSGRVLLISSITVLLVCCRKEEKAVPPMVETSEISSITDTSAAGGGNVTDDGGASVTSRGVCWSTSEEPEISDHKTLDGKGSGKFSSEISGLLGGTAYFLRAYAINNAGTGYGTVLSFRTLGDEPSAVTLDATLVLTHSATLNATVNPNYLTTQVSFEYGTDTQCCQFVPSSQSPVKGTGDMNVNTDLAGLTPGTQYHFRVITENELGTVYGDYKSFTTLGQAPEAITAGVSNVLSHTATLNAAVNPNHLPATVVFEYGTDKNYGQDATASQSPLTGNTMVMVHADITGLLAGTTYHFRIKAVNELGTTYGRDTTFTTLQKNQITDVDGNIYNTVIIGTQVWMAENLKVIHYRDGRPITKVMNVPWKTLTTGAYGWYNDDSLKYKKVFGALYNWYSVETDKLCPSGWHVPDNEDWDILTHFLGGEKIAGEKLKTIEYWKPFDRSTNESNFAAVPGGYRNPAFINLDSGMGLKGYWWSSTYGSPCCACFRMLSSGTSKFYSFDGTDGFPYTCGFSVRCVKD